MVVVAAGNVKISVPESQDLIVISGGNTEYKFQTTQQEADAAAAFTGSGNAPAASASRDLVMFALGGVKGTVRSGRDAILVSMGASTANVSAGGDAILYAFDGIQRTHENLIPTFTGGGDAILISGSSAVAHVVGGKNAMLVALGSTSESIVSGSEFAGLVTLGFGLNVQVSGAEGAFAWAYGDLSGSVVSSTGSAVASSIGNTVNTIVHGKENAIAMTVGSFSGTVTADDEYAGIISLLDATGTVSAGKGAVVVADGSVNVDVAADEDLLVWARGNVNGTYHAGRDAAVVSHGTYDASLTADRDIVFAYAGTSLRGSLTAGRWIGDGSTSPPGDPTEIDDVFSHGDIMAQLLAGTAASSDPNKGRIGTIGSIGNAGGSYAAQHINRIRTAGVVTASVNSSAASFAASNDGSTATGGNGTLIILQNQTTLSTLVPKPVLDPSERPQILADADTARDEALADRAETVGAIEDEQAAIAEERATAEAEKSEVRSELSTEADLIMQAADLAVSVAAQLVRASLAKSRNATEDMLRQTEAGYLKLEAEIRLLRDSMRESADAAQAAAVDAMVRARTILRDVSDPAAEKKQKGIQSNGVFEINTYKSNYDVSRAVVAQRLYGYMWQVELALQDPTYENYFDNDATAALSGFLEGLGVGARATGNGAIDTAWGFVTLGFGEPWNVFDTTGEGYATSYMFARGGFELLAGLGLGAAASAPGKLGKIAFTVDMAGNSTAVARGGYGVYRDGELNFSNGAELIGGAVGIGGGVLGKAFKSADELADASKIDGGCFLPGQMVADLEAKPEPLLAAGVTGQTNDAEHDRMEAWILSLLAAGVAIAALRLERRRLRHSLGAAQSRQIVLLDELFTSESPWEPQPEDQCGALAVT